MKKLSALIGLISCLVLSSCSSGTYLTPYTPSTSPTTSAYLPPPTTTAKTITTSANAEKDAILAFTLQALAIEAQRDALVNCYAGERETGGLFGWKFVTSKTFLDGVTPANPYSLIGVPPSGLEGMTSLRQKMILLSCPQSMQSIKDALVSIYNSEVEIGAPYYTSDLIFDSDGRLRYVAVSMENLDYWVQLFHLVEVDRGALYPGVYIQPSYFESIVNSDWYKLQSFRRDTYIQWSQLLKQHGVDSTFVDASIK